MISTSANCFFASANAPLAISIGFWSIFDSKNLTSACSASVRSCSIAAGRYTSVLATITDFWLLFFNHRPSLAVDVVLPAPWSPAIKMTAGGCTERLSSPSPAPITLTSSSLTILIKTWPGDRLAATSVPRALTFTLSINSLTTTNATSASSRATRTSRSASWIFSSVNLAFPVIEENAEPSLSVNDSNTDLPDTCYWFRLV